MIGDQDNTIYLRTDSKKLMKEDSKSSGWVTKLQRRWGVTAPQVFIILIVFACTGFSVMFLKRPIVSFFTDGGEKDLLFSLVTTTRIAIIF